MRTRKEITVKIDEVGPKPILFLEILLDIRDLLAKKSKNEK